MNRVRNAGFFAECFNERKCLCNRLKDIAINLDLSPDEDEDIVLTEVDEGASTISVHKLLNGQLTELFDEYSKDQIKKIELYKNRLTGYDFSTIVISEYPIDVACEIFTRINTGGTELSLFEIMVAKTYDQTKQFDLAEEYDKLIDSKNSDKDLTAANYETMSSQTILQCISAHLCNQVRRKDILKLDKKAFIKEWPTVKEGIFSAIDYLRSHLRVKVSRILPYNILLVPFSYFFIRNKGKKPSKTQNVLLTQYFWWASLSGRFSSAQESKVALDLAKMENILNEKQPSYRGEEVNIEIDKLKWYWFSTGDAFCKAILCLLAYFEPKAFDTNSIVTLDNSWLKIANSKNYHHFFPKNYLEKQGYESWQANSLINITFVDDYLNKNIIRAKSPSKYLAEFKKNNLEFDKTMSSHLIYPDSYGVWDDDYDVFINKRAQKIMKELQKRLNPVI